MSRPWTKSFAPEEIMMTIYSKLLGAAALATIALTSVPASALVDVTFTYLSGGSPVATGEFTYADGLTGVLGYGDLTSFSVTAAGVTYTLADVLPLTDYVHFGYDTAAVDFTIDSNSCGFAGCGFISSLSAIDSAGDFGFFFTPVPGVYNEYSTDTLVATDDLTFVSVESNGTVPEPASWALMVAGFGLVGAGLRRRTLAIA
jgi:hypothetical protein